MVIANSDKTRRAYVNAQLVDPANGLDEKGGVLIEDGRIVAIGKEIGRASCRERVCPYVEIQVVAVSIKKKNT